MRDAIRRDDPKGVGVDADYSEGQVCRDCALTGIFCGPTLGPDQSDCARAPEYRAALGAEGQGVHRATQNGAALPCRRRPGLRRERLSLLQGLQKNDRHEVYRLRRAGAPYIGRMRFLAAAVAMIGLLVVIAPGVPGCDLCGCYAPQLETLPPDPGS